MACNSAEEGSSVTRKIAAILMTFTDCRAHSLTEIAHLADLPMSMAQSGVTNSPAGSGNGGWRGGRRRDHEGTPR